MRTTAGSTNPWGNSIDDGWKDLVVSSAPPPPPAREDAVVKNKLLPADLSTWQEHGAARAQLAPAVVDEPSFSKGDRRLWVIAGSLMGAAALVLGLLGALTFGPPSAPVAGAAPVADPAPAAAVAPSLSPSPSPSPSRASAPSHAVAAATPAKSSNPRLLKTASHSSRGRHHKRVAAR